MSQMLMSSKVCHKHQFLLFTSDKSMRETHYEELLKTDSAIVASATNNGSDVSRIYPQKLVEAKARVLRDFKGKLDRPYFCVIQKSGLIENRPIKPISRKGKL
jgi:hypothetical protein